MIQSRGQAKKALIRIYIQYQIGINNIDDQRESGIDNLRMRAEEFLIF